MTYLGPKVLPGAKAISWGQIRNQSSSLARAKIPTFVQRSYLGPKFLYHLQAQLVHLVSGHVCGSEIGNSIIVG